LIGDYLISK
ncbi:fatty acid hydroxylase superfamily protein, partial [Vibrio parahaemolyticus V-223/04]